MSHDVETSVKKKPSLLRAGAIIVAAARVWSKQILGV